jgi:hypothetical protein
MDNQGNHAWLAEVVEDMISFCARNELFESVAILSTAHGIIVSEVASQKLKSENSLKALKHATKMPQ